MVRETCCGRPRCDEHYRKLDLCYMCKQELTPVARAWSLPRTAIVLAGWYLGFEIWGAIASRWGIAAFAVTMVLAVLLQGSLYKRARYRVLVRRGRQHDWTRPSDLPVPSADSPIRLRDLMLPTRFMAALTGRDDR